MKEQDAVAAFTALAEPLEWQCRTWDNGNTVWIAQKEITDKRYYVFNLKPPSEFGLGCDEKGVSFSFLLVCVYAERTSKKTRDLRGNIHDETTPLGKWCFPCRTVAEGKAICERLALTDSFEEVKRRDRLRYPLTWEAYNCSPRRCQSDLWKDWQVVASYNVSLRRRCFSRTTPPPVRSMNRRIKSTAPLRDSMKRHRTPICKCTTCAHRRKRCATTRR